MALDEDKRTPISVSRIKAGMLVEFRYVKLDGTGDTYTVLVIDPYKKTDTSPETYLHGFTLKDMSDDDLTEFLSEVGRSGLDTDEAYEKFANSRYVEQRPYRTFILKKMSNVKQIKR